MNAGSKLTASTEPWSKGGKTYYHATMVTTPKGYSGYVIAAYLSTKVACFD